jgi:hypothetical protein
MIASRCLREVRLLVQWLALVALSTEVHSAIPNWIHSDQFIFLSLPWKLSSDSCRVFYYGAPSLTRGWVCKLQLLLGLCSKVFLVSWVQRNSWPYFTVSVLSLLQLAGSDSPVISPKVKVILWLTVSRPVSPGIRSPSVTCDQYLWLYPGTSRCIKQKSRFPLWLWLCFIMEMWGGIHGDVYWTFVPYQRAYVTMRLETEIKRFVSVKQP